MSASTTSLSTALRRGLSQPQFLAAFIVLFVAALSLNGATQYLRLYFKKEPVPLAKALDEIPPLLGPWVQVSQDPPMDPEMLDILGTKQYVFRDYVDSRLVDAPTIAEFKTKTDREQAALLSRIQLEHPAAVVRAAVTYYTGMVDTVAHIPDRCYVADGFEPRSKEFPTWTVADRNHKPVKVTVSSIHFEDSVPGRGSVTRNVAYFFHCNGGYEYDAISGVRIRLQNLAERHAYYAKIEVMTSMDDHQKSDQVIADFLTNALPEIEACLPDWQQVKAGRVPARKEPAARSGA